jgi:hypothetical protein
MVPVYLQRMLIILSGFTSLPIIAFMSFSSDPLPGIRLNAAILQFPHMSSWRVEGFYHHFSSVAEELLGSLLYSLTVLHML